MCCLSAMTALELPHVHRLGHTRTHPESCQGTRCPHRGAAGAQVAAWGAASAGCFCLCAAERGKRSCQRRSCQPARLAGLRGVCGSWRHGCAWHSAAHTAGPPCPPETTPVTNQHPRCAPRCALRSSLASCPYCWWAAWPPAGRQKSLRDAPPEWGPRACSPLHAWRGARALAGPCSPAGQPWSAWWCGGGRMS